MPFLSTSLRLICSPEAEVRVKVGAGLGVMCFGFRCQVLFCPDEALDDGDEDQGGKNTKERGDVGRE